MDEQHESNPPAALGPRERAKVRSTTLSDELQDMLEDLIVSGGLKPGSRLDDSALAERFRVSRTPVREALKALAGNGLVEIRGREGVFVASVSLPVLIEMFQMMAVMEGLCAKFAARRASAEQKQALLGIHARLVEQLQSGDHLRFYDINQEFHDALYDASNTHYLAEQTRSLRKRVRVYRRYVTFQPGRMSATIGEHQRILDAIARNDPSAAFGAAVDHVSLLEDDMVDLIAAIESNTSAVT
jgi:DNA-binding GntR family transcriptional regulator